MEADGTRGLGGPLGVCVYVCILCICVCMCMWHICGVHMCMYVHLCGMCACVLCVHVCVAEAVAMLCHWQVLLSGQHLQTEGALSDELCQPSAQTLPLAPGREACRSGEMAKQGLGQGPASPAGPAWWVQGCGLSPHNPWNEASQTASHSPSALIIRNKAEQSADLCFEVAWDGWDYTDPDNPITRKSLPFQFSLEMEEKVPAGCCLALTLLKLCPFSGPRPLGGNCVQLFHGI